VKAIREGRRVEAMTGLGRESSAAQVRGDETRGYTLHALPPQSFGRYMVIGKLGHGGMAEVVLAVQSGKAGFRKLVVLKRLHAKLEGEPGFVDMFLDEARLAAQLDHPHCVQTLEVGEHDGQHFLAMEYLDGQGLEKLLRASAKRGLYLPVEIATRMIADALDGLSYAHELIGYDGKPLGVVHRDISPQNIFVTYQGVVKLLDFGIAKAESNVVETRTGVIKGKFAYIAPEQALGSGLDPRADVWSMGVVLWESLTSRRLFKSENELATLQESLRGAIAPPSDYQPDVPPELDAIVLQALARDPDERFQSAADFRNALEEWLATRTVPAGRKQIAALMHARFAEVQAVQRQTLASCVAALPIGPSTLEGLVRAATPAPTSLPPPHPESDPPPASSGGEDWTRSAPTTHIAVLAKAAAAASERRSGIRELSGGDRRRRRAWMLIAAAAVTVLLVGLAIAIAATERSGAPARSTEQTVSGVLPVEAVPPAAEAGGAGIAVGDRAPTRAGPPESEGIGEERAVEVGAVTTPTEPIETSPAPARRRARRDRQASTSATTSASTGTTATEHGFLSLMTSPWTNVTLDGRTLGDTPLVRLPLPPGSHTLHLTNPDEGISEIYEVEIRAGEITTRRLGLR
jgi:serine/threonine protein kinase